MASVLAYMTGAMGTSGVLLAAWSFLASCRESSNTPAMVTESVALMPVMAACGRGRGAHMKWSRSELCEGGRNIRVGLHNVRDYVRLVTMRWFGLELEPLPYMQQQP